LTEIEAEIARLTAAAEAIRQVFTQAVKRPAKPKAKKRKLDLLADSYPTPAPDGLKAPSKAEVIRHVMRRFNAAIMLSDIVTILKGTKTPLTMKQAYNHLYVGQKRGWFERTDRGWVLTDLGREDN